VTRRHLNLGVIQRILGQLLMLALMGTGVDQVRG